MWHCTCVHKQKKKHFHAKMTSAKLYIYIGVWARDLYIDEARMALDMFRFAAFFILYNLKPYLNGFILCHDLNPKKDIKLT